MDNLPFVDASKVAVWGWSYGGYLSARMLAEDEEDLISCTMSVAPVARWDFYGESEAEIFMSV